MSASVFDNLDALRLGPDPATLDGVREVLATVPVRKPKKTEFVRVHPDPAMTLDTAVFEDKDERGETYFVLPQLRAAMIDELRPVLLMTAITRQNVTFLWPVRLPDGARANAWADSAREAAEAAKSEWVRVVPDMHLGAYRIQVAAARLPDPAWRDEPLTRLLELGFRNRIIDSEDHPILRRLRGEA